MITFDNAIAKFLQEQKETLQPRTYDNYDSVMELFTLYINGYGFFECFTKGIKQFEEEAEESEKKFSEIVHVTMLDDGLLGSFFTDFLIRKVAAAPSLMQNAVRVVKKFINWLQNEKYLNKEQLDELNEFFVDMKQGKLLVNAMKLADLLFEFNGDQQNSYDEELEGYFFISEIKNNNIWLDESMDDRSDLGPIHLPKGFIELCQESMEISGVIARKGSNWYLLETWNVYP